MSNSTDTFDQEHLNPSQSAKVIRQLLIRIAELERVQQQQRKNSSSIASFDLYAQNGNAADESDVDDHQMQQKEFRKMLAKFEMELKDVKQLSMITKFELENRVLQAELKHQKLLTEHNALQVKMAEKEKQKLACQLEQLKNEQKTESDQMKQKHENDSEQLKTKIDELAQQLKEMENFVGVLKDQFGNELLKAVSSNIRANIEEVFSNKNCWNSEACHGDLAILGSECLMVHYKKEGNVWRSLFAKCPIPRSNFGISYYEVKIMNMKGFICIGFATKQLEFDKGVGGYSDSYSYTSNGKFWINSSIKGAKPTFVRDDVVGCGVNLATGQIIFTKNGQQLDTGDLFVSSTDSLFPCVSLRNCGDLIETNFGPDFKFNLADV